MKLILTTNLADKPDLMITAYFEEDTNYSKPWPELPVELNLALKKKTFSKKFGEVYSTRIKGKKVLVFGLGKKAEFNPEKARRICGKMVNAAKASKAESFSTDLPERLRSLNGFNAQKYGQTLAEGLLLADYNFEKYLSEEKKKEQVPLKEVYLQITTVSATFEKGLNVGRIIADATNLARDWVNEPADVVDSVYLENAARKIAAANKKISLKVLNQAEMKKLGLNALLGVNAGSVNPPKMLIIEYKGDGTKKPIALIGKGITFDSGGYNLKPTRYIEDMKTDMAGAGAVLATIKAAAELGLQKNLLGVMPLCENMIGSKAQKPGNIVKAYNGKTIEIGNTDAEGRLILADALAYIEDQYKPEIMIDLATLTGACVVALGYYSMGLLTKDERLSKELQQAGDLSGDKAWPLPMYEEFQDWMDGTISDLNNNGNKGKGYEAGTITAAIFLSHFVGKTKWAHLDIAATAYWPISSDYLQKGATGSGVRILLYYLMNN